MRRSQSPCLLDVSSARRCFVPELAVSAVFKASQIERALNLRQRRWARRPREQGRQRSANPKLQVLARLVRRCGWRSSCSQTHQRWRERLARSEAQPVTLSSKHGSSCPRIACGLNDACWVMVLFQCDGPVRRERAHGYIWRCRGGGGVQQDRSLQLPR